MKYVITGDWHLADGSRADTSLANRDPESMDAMVDYWEDNHVRLILGGDVCECLWCDVPAIGRRHGDIMHRIWGNLLVGGNHERHAMLSVVAKWNLFSCPRAELNGELIVHGHQGDQHCTSPLPGVDTITAIITAYIANKRGGDTDRALWPFQAALAVHNWLHGKKSAFQSHIDAMRKVLDDSEEKWIICGHTHKAGTIGDWYVNWGCLCGDGPQTFIELEDGGDVRIVEWRDRSPIVFEKSLQ